MNILVVGNGGREHAIIWAIKEARSDAKVFCANGNAGIASLAKCVDISPEDVGSLADFAASEKIDLTFIGGESSLAHGVADEFEKRGFRIVGPSKAAARLESSKAFAKEFMQRHSIPTARYETAKSAAEANEILDSGRFGDEYSPVVIKADGLAAGKGVVVAKDRFEAKSAVTSLISGELIDPRAAGKIIIEECLFGDEISLLLFSDGKHFALMPPSKDHKRIGEGDTGPNTGGMGTITDPSLLSKKQIAEVVVEVIEPTLRGAREDGFPFKGVLFLGLMMTENGAKVLEYNVRFGDPETQAILVNLETDFVEICEAICDQTLDKTVISWKEGSSACVILAAKNYPGAPRKGDIIRGIEEAEKHENLVIFHAGTKQSEGGDFITFGGRVLAVTSTASNISNALHRAYKAVNEISWEGMQYRLDIGK